MPSGAASVAAFSLAASTEAPVVPSTLASPLVATEKA
jgi:hypothetical protein